MVDAPESPTITSIRTYLSAADDAIVAGDLATERALCERALSLMMGIPDASQESGNSVNWQSNRMELRNRIAAIKQSQSATQSVVRQKVTYVRPTD